MLVFTSMTGLGLFQSLKNKHLTHTRPFITKTNAL